MKQPTVSVIVPAYNEENHIAACLSALSSTISSVDEIIVVDNNSIDNTATIVKGIAKTDSQITYILEPNQGTMFARKNGFDSASGDFLATIDSDSIVEEGWRDGMLKGIHGYDAISSYGKLDIEQIPRTNYILTNSILYKLFPFMIGAKAFLFGSNMMMKRKTWSSITDQVRLEKRIWDDVEITKLVEMAGYRIGTTKQVLFIFSTRRSLDSPKEMYDYAANGRYTLSKYSTLRPYALLVLVLPVIVLVLIILKPINYFEARFKSG